MFRPCPKNSSGEHQVGSGATDPFDIEDVNLDFQILEEQVSADQMPVLLVAAKRI